jgi:hypothetical protein
VLLCVAAKTGCPWRRWVNRVGFAMSAVMSVILNTGHCRFAAMTPGLPAGHLVSASQPAKAPLFNFWGQTREGRLWKTSTSRLERDKMASNGAA